MTAVEFLISKLNLSEDAPVCIQAKQMEKDQIMDAYIDRMDCTNKEMMREILGGEYYNKTYTK